MAQNSSWQNQPFQRPVFDQPSARRLADERTAVSLPSDRDECGGRFLGKGHCRFHGAAGLPAMRLESSRNSGTVERPPAAWNGAAPTSHRGMHDARCPTPTRPRPRPCRCPRCHCRRAIPGGRPPIDAGDRCPRGSARGRGGSVPPMPAGMPQAMSGADVEEVMPGR
jgi:hypothetical protein